MKKFRGTYTVLITPFTADGKKVDAGAWATSANVAVKARFA